MVGQPWRLRLGVCQNSTSDLIYVSVFSVVTELWCDIGDTLVKNRLMDDKISRCGHVGFLIVLVLLGLPALWGRRVLFD